MIDCDTDEAIDLPSLVEMLERDGLDPRDEDGFSAWGGALKKLSNNRAFLGDLMIEELKQRCAGQLHDNQYSAQVIMLHVSRNNYLIRANLWPAEADSVVRQSGADPFFYHVPHDHNFSFLTVGYFGPGYWSDYYEYDYERVAGFAGEPVDLRFVERTRLDRGKVMLYRAHRDVHLQFPADSLSVSLNIMEHSASAAFRDQYRFDVEAGTVSGILSRTPLEPLLLVAAHNGGGNGEDLLASFAAGHPSDRIRWCALRARAGATATIDARLKVLEAGARDSSRFVAEMARRMIEQIEHNRAWIERPQAVA